MPQIIIHDGLTGKTLDVTKSTVIGRGPECDLVINVDRLSRRHARIDVDSGLLVIEDLNSHNGTKVNGQRIVQPHVLRPGDEIQLSKKVRLTYPEQPIAKRDGEPTHGVTAITFRCPGCGRLLKAAPSCAGKQGHCRACGVGFIAPRTSVTQAPRPATSVNDRPPFGDVTVNPSSGSGALAVDAEPAALTRLDESLAAVGLSDPAYQWELGGRQNAPIAATTCALMSDAMSGPGRRPAFLAHDCDGSLICDAAWDAKPTALARMDDDSLVERKCDPSWQSERASEGSFVAVADTVSASWIVAPADTGSTCCETDCDRQDDPAALAAEPLRVDHEADDGLEDESVGEGGQAVVADSGGPSDGRVSEGPVLDPQQEHVRNIGLASDRSPEPGSYQERPAVPDEELVLEGHDGPILDMAVDEACGRIVTAGADKTLRLWGLDGQQQATVLATTESSAWAVRFSPDGRHVFSAHHSGEIVIWDMATRTEAGRIGGKAGAMHSLCVSPDGLTLAVGGEDGVVRLWDVLDRVQCRSIPGHGEAVSALSFLGPERLASISWDGTLRVLDITGRDVRPRVIELKKGRNHCIACGRTNGAALVAGDDGVLRLWDLDSAEMVREISGHEQRVNCLAVSADGRRAVSGGDDRTVRLWDVRTGELLEQWAEHTGWVSAVAFADHDQRILSTGWDGVGWNRPVTLTAV